MANIDKSCQATNLERNSVIQAVPAIKVQNGPKQLSTL